ncbi:zinc-binding dehydrogenase [Parasphingorhabdus sp.]|uniref:zinc-binding dehydrogenase n=1 Tax=Parasphingorhabdus sp. TaxID=2709688 RepID=UPI002F93C992
MNDVTGLELRSIVNADCTLTLSLEEVVLSSPASDEIIVRVEAAPINPSDIGLLLSSADIRSVRLSGSADRPVATFSVPQGRMEALQTRIGVSMAVGNEGAGIVVDAGRDAKALIGKRVAMAGGGMYSQYRKLKQNDAVELPENVSSVAGAAMFVNPLTALAFVETMKMEGHKAIVHTAAASNLGQMLQKICLHDGIPLVNIVRSAEQAQILRDIGAAYVADSTDPDFTGKLEDMVAQTGATLAFDAIGGGTLGSQILEAMEHAANRTTTEFSRYGSSLFKQLYIYGALDLGPIVTNRMAIGFEWSVNGFLLGPFIKKAGSEVYAAMRQRALQEITTTFASHYSATISLREALDPDTLKSYCRRATGEKYLIDPTR